MALSKDKSAEVEEFIWYKMMNESGDIILSPDLLDSLVMTTKIGLKDAEEIIRLIEHDWSNNMYN